MHGQPHISADSVYAVILIFYFYWSRRSMINDTGQQNLTFFFGPRISIDELGSTFYAEFRHVYRIILSGRVSKIQRAVFCAKQYFAC